jgi:NAD(P)-dependent dehydrogenase (short-subunit alcohol dehydrogenase family)
MAQLENKTALVTGGTSGIGLAAARRFAAEGAHVFITGRRKPELDAAAALMRSGVTAVQGDVSSLDDLDRLAEAIARRGSGLDVVFANAGGGSLAALGDITPEQFGQTFAINVRGIVFTVQKTLPFLTHGASIVLAGSSSATNGTPGFSLYAASKAAIRSLARTWAAELAARGIRVNTIVPGPTNTPGLRSGLAPEVLQAIASGIPLGRLAEPDEIASAVLFLASPQSSFMTGSEIFIDGGVEQI